MFDEIKNIVGNMTCVSFLTWF